MSKFTADLCDKYPDDVSLLGPGYQHYGGAFQAEGTICTIRLDRSNADLIGMLRDEKGQGKIAVVDVERAYYAVVGENLMKFALASGYAGIIVNGYIRDTWQIQDIPVPLIALGTCARKYIPVTQATRDVTLSFGGVEFCPGDYLYADTDGVIVTAKPLSLD